MIVPVPPDPDAVAVPSAAPLQPALVEEMLTATAVGSAMVTSSVSVHPFASVAVTVYVPAVSPEAVAEDPPPPDQAYVIVPVPPDPDAVADPSLPPLQLTSVGVPIETDTAVG